MRLLFEDFSIDGSLNEARRELIQHRRLQILRVAVVAASLLVAAMLIIWLSVSINTEPSPGPDEAKLFVKYKEDVATVALAGVLVGYFMMFMLFSMISGSLMFGELTTKEGRIGFFMFPESITDKYVGRWLVYVVGFSVMYVIASVAMAPLAWCLSKLIFGNALDFACVRVAFDNLFNDEFFRMFWPMIISVPMAGSFFVVGSVAFPRYTFIKVFAILTVVQVIMETIFMCFVPLFLIISQMDLKINAIEWIQGVSACLMAILMLFNWCMGLMWLRNTDVIE